jgi:ubiquitin-small subunit ribosomal protein S27Ae
MQVFIHQLDGSVVTADPAQFDSLEALLLSLNAEECRAVYQGAHLNSLEELRANANVYLTADLSGGKRKRKKKVYTTKKKNKHIHKKVKLGIYQLYSVDGTFSLIQARAP